MEIKLENWNIKKLIIKKDKINPKPQYQRTPVWNDTKKQLLMDSILRGYDLPKFYIRKTPRDPVYEYEVIDGQQRMRAIWEFYENGYALNNTVINGRNLIGRKYQDLNNRLQEKYKKFKLSFSLIEKALPEEIRSLFARLQMGVSLNPAELRHAIASNLGNNIQMIVENHKFFGDDCKIKNKRYKHQDYLDNAATIVFYNNKYDLKAPTLKKLYEELSSAKAEVLSPKFNKINKILDWMYEVNSYSKGIFKNKWGFVDIFNFLNENYKSIKVVNAEDFALELLKFEKKRKKYNSEPEKLIEDKTSDIYDRDLYEYINAFKIQGGITINLKIRARIFNKLFNNRNYLIFK